jgi:hypothetical protein
MSKLLMLNTLYSELHKSNTHIDVSMHIFKSSFFIGCHFCVVHNTKKLDCDFCMLVDYIVNYIQIYFQIF